MLFTLEITHNLELNQKDVSLPLSYEIFGKELGSAPVILINHAFTGNSTVTGPKGWWNSLVGNNKTINLQDFTILSFNIPGNGYDGFLIENYKEFSTKDIAKIFLKGLKSLSINQLHTLIGSSLGGIIAWEMAFIKPDLALNLIPIACDYRASDWLIAQCKVQDLILNNSSDPLKDARIHAMLLYRTPASINQRFNNQNTENSEETEIENWLNYHGNALDKRFTLEAYKLMNHLLKTSLVTQNIEDLAIIQSKIHLISIDSDLFFTQDRAEFLFKELRKLGAEISLNTLKSIHGHDAFLIETQQLNPIISSIINPQHCHAKSAQFKSISL